MQESADCSVDGDPTTAVSDARDEHRFHFSGPRQGVAFGAVNIKTQTHKIPSFFVL